MTTALIAYIDPGSGALLLQVLLASLLTFAMFFRRILLAPFRMFFGRNEAKAAAGGPATEAKSESGDGTSDGTD